MRVRTSIPRAARALLGAAALAAVGLFAPGAATPAAAQCNLISGCEAGPPSAGFEPYGGSYSGSAASLQVVVTVQWCTPSGVLGARTITLDGVSVSGSFSFGYDTVEGCSQYGTSTGTITLTPGPHILAVSVTNSAGLSSSDAATFTYTQTGAPPSLRVTPDAQAVQRVFNQHATERFTVENLGAAQATFRVAGVCSGAGVGSCNASRSTVTVPAGGSVSVGVSYGTTTQGSSGTVALAAWKQGDSAAVNESGSYAVAAVAAPQPGLAGDSGSVTAYDRSECLMLPAGPDAVYECGDLRLAHALPATRALNKAFAPTLLYNSQHAYPFPFVAANVFSPGPTLPSTVRMTLTIAGTSRTAVFDGYLNGTNRLGVGVDASGIATGYYDYTLVGVAHYPDGSTRTLYSGSGTLPIVNRSQSRFGRGWWMAGLEEVKPSGGGSLMWIGGDGSTLRYLPVATDRWAAEPYATPDTIVRLGDGSYRRLLAGGDSVAYDALGKHAYTVNRRGHRTSFTWSGTALAQVTLPKGSGLAAAPVYTFEYNNPYSMLSRVVAPNDGAARNVAFENADGRVTAISGPDTTGVRFSFVDATPRVTGRRDRRHVWSSYRYDSGSRLKRAVAGEATPDSAVFTYAALESRGNFAVVVTSAHTLFDGPRADADAVDRTTVVVDRRGAPVTVTDALGGVTRIYREDPRFPGLVTRVRHANNREVASTYDDAGRLSSTTDWSAASGGRYATTLYEWDARCDELSRVTLPEGEVTSTGYSVVGCLPIWTQHGHDPARRVTFENKFLDDPYAPGLPSLVIEPGSHTQVFGYDTRGNLSSVRTPLGFTATFQNDALGRVRVARTPINAAQGLFQTDSTVYDLRDRVVRADSYGPRLVDALVTADSQRVVVETDYDQEGLVRSVSRRSQPDPASIGAIATRWKHDPLRRVVAEIAADSTPATWDDNPRDSTVYNATGLPVWARTRRGDTLRTRYDALSRPLVRYHSGVRYDSTSAGVPSKSGRQLALCGSLSTGYINHPYPAYPTDADCSFRIPADSSVFAYDAMGNVKSADNAAASIRRTYFTNGLLESDTTRVRTVDGAVSSRAPYVLTYAYDLNGRRTRLTPPLQLAPSSGAATLYGYDPVTGALASVTDPMGHVFRYVYDLRGQLDTLALPAGMWHAYRHDADGRLSRYTLSVPSVSTALSDVSFVYDQRAKMLQSTNSGAGQETLQARFSALGHLVYNSYSSVATTQVERTATNSNSSTMRYDALGNGVETVNASGTSIPDEGFWRPGQGSASSSNSLSYYHPLTGRLRLRVAAQTFTEYVYDRAGNVAAERTSHTSATSGFYGVDRISYFDALGRLRAVDSRSKVTLDQESAVWEDYRYDALGRRVQVRTRQWCSGARPRCSYDTVRRTVWDGDQVLFEIRMAESEGDSDGLPSQQARTTDFDPNPMLGRVLLTHGPGMDQPLSAIRMGLGDHPYGGTYESWPTFAVIPLWNQRGQAPFVTFGGGTRKQCSLLAASRCLSTYWLLAWDAYGARNNGAVLSSGGYEAVWMGGIMEDQHDASGLLYRRNRYYDPASGRFTQEDPIGLAGGLNIYGFANGDPVTYDDPFGLCPWCAAGVLALRAAPYVAAGAKLLIGALDPNPDMGTAIVSGGKVVMRAAGQAGRRAFGEATFRGLAQNRRLTDLTHNEITRAFQNTPYTISSHAINRLKDSRTSALGAETLNDIANLLNRGEVRNAGGGDVAIQLGRLEAIVDPATKVIETIRPYRQR